MKEERGRSHLVRKEIARREAQSTGSGKLTRRRAARRLRRSETARREAALRRQPQGQHPHLYRGGPEDSRRGLRRRPDGDSHQALGRRQAPQGGRSGGRGRSGGLPAGAGPEGQGRGAPPQTNAAAGGGGGGPPLSPPQ